MENNVQYGFYFDSSKCTGCKTCHIACKDRMAGLEYPAADIKNRGVPAMKGVKWRRIYEYVGGSTYEVGDGVYENDVFVNFTAISCNHCSNPVCVKACPTGAMHKRRNDGLVHVDQKVCIGCESCARACPYDAPQLDPARMVMTKCDGCADRLKVDSTGRLIAKPVCVEACPLRALDFDTMDNLVAKYGHGDGHIEPLPGEHITTPNLLFKANANSRPGGKVTNPNEV